MKKNKVIVPDRIFIILIGCYEICIAMRRPFTVLFSIKYSAQGIHYSHKTDKISFKIIDIVYCKARREGVPVVICHFQECNAKEYRANAVVFFKDNGCNPQAYHHYGKSHAKRRGGCACRLPVFDDRKCCRNSCYGCQYSPNMDIAHITLTDGGGHGAGTVPRGWCPKWSAMRSLWRTAARRAAVLQRSLRRAQWQARRSAFPPQC